MISVFISMLILNIPLAIVTLIMGGIMVITSRVITKNQVSTSVANKKI